MYTVEEGTNLESQVFITKADGFSTEEDIDIRVTAIPQTAQLGKPQYLGFMQNRLILLFIQAMTTRLPTVVVNSTLSFSPAKTRLECLLES